MINIYDVIKESEHLFINNELCSKCKGRCCKITPCSYFPSDLDMNKESILKLLEEGKASIKVKIMGFLDGKKIATVPVPIVGVRGRKKEAIDLLSPSVRCIALGSNGCELENKPMGAKILIPGEDGYMNGGNNPCYNLLGAQQHLVLYEWMKHFEVLVNVVEEFSQESFEHMYLKDLLTTTLTLLKDDSVSEYNRASLTPILESMQMFSLIANGKITNINVINNPNSNQVNYLTPSENIYHRVRAFNNSNTKK